MCKHRPKGGLSVLASQTGETTVLALSRGVGSDMAQDPPNVSTSVILLWKTGGVIVQVGSLATRTAPFKFCSQTLTFQFSKLFHSPKWRFLSPS